MHKRLAQCRDEHGRWDVGGGGGGGGLRHLNRVEEDICREIAEEFCTDVLEIEFLGYCSQLKFFLEDYKDKL